MWKRMESMLNRLLDERGIKKGASSSNPTPRRVKKDNDLENEKDRGHHSEHLV